ncbi:MAG: hypothetical protein RLZZ476_392, partial [Verrucomicrobiota bacterium]
MQGRGVKISRTSAAGRVMVSASAPPSRLFLLMESYFTPLHTFC